MACPRQRHRPYWIEVANIVRSNKCWQLDCKTTPHDLHLISIVLPHSCQFLHPLQRHPQALHRTTRKRKQKTPPPPPTTTTPKNWLPWPQRHALLSCETYHPSHDALQRIPKARCPHHTCNPQPLPQVVHWRATASNTPSRGATWIFSGTRRATKDVVPRARKIFRGFHGGQDTA